MDDDPDRPGVEIHGEYIHRIPTKKESERAFRSNGSSDDRPGSRAEESDEQGCFRIPKVFPDRAFDLTAILIAPPNRKGQRIVLGEVKIARPTVKPGATLDLGMLRVIALSKR